MPSRGDEPSQHAGAIFHTGAGFHSYPPPRARFAARRKVCGHCGLAANTHRASCPVCATRYEPDHTLARLARRLRIR